MAVSMADISHLRKMSGAGMMDCKKALEEACGDFDKAMEIIRKKGQAVAAKRSDRDAAEGCVLAADNGDFAAVVALKCETDFVAKNADFVALTQEILNIAMDKKPATKEDLLALPMADGRSIQDHITDRSGITGEKMELGYYDFVKGNATISYIHPGNKLATVAAFNQALEHQMARDIAMQVAAMNPVAVNRESVPAAVVEAEYNVAVEKTKEEQVKKAVEAALKKAGFNLYISENEEHLNEGIMKGNITEAQAQEIRDLKAKVAEEKAANLPTAMIDNIAKGRVNKFYKESVLLEQEFVKDAKLTIEQYLHSASKDLTVTGFKRFTLNVD
jgi:elongation factor Ts